MSGPGDLDFLAIGDGVIKLHADHGHKVDDHLQRLCKFVGDVVGSNANIFYFVLNHTRPNGRHFAAWLSERCSCPSRSIPNAETPPQHTAFNGPAELRAPWLNNWSTYASKTATLNKSDRHTWNDFLLNRADVPRTLGLSWGNASSQPYYRGESKSDIEALDAAILACVNGSTANPASGGRKKGDKASLANGTAATMAAELRRFYGDWGGSAFLSIPVFTQKPRRGTVSVLSICTGAPLTHPEITAWSYLAQCLLAPVTQFVFEEQRQDAEQSAHVASCPETKKVWDTAKRVADSPASILIQAATGTGKQLLAEHVRKSSPFDKTLIHVNCAAIPPDLFESEMFGHVKGSFTGAIKDKDGKFKEAIDGTLFLDEVGETSPLIQAKLLSALDGAKVTPVGGSTPIDISKVRIIAATNVDLSRAVAEGKFRADLYYRLACAHLRLPPLHERPEAHFRALVHHLIERHRGRYSRSFTLPSDAAISRLRADGKDWPGNVRQLEQCIESALAMHQGTGELLIDPPVASASPHGTPGADGADLAVFDDIARQLLNWVQGVKGPVALSPLKRIIMWRLLGHASHQNGGPRPDEPGDRRWQGLGQKFGTTDRALGTWWNANHETASSDVKNCCPKNVDSDVASVKPDDG